MATGLVDIGVNLTNSRFDADRDTVLQRALEGEHAPLSALLVTGTSIEESRKAIELCELYSEQYPQQLFATAGIHPHEASQFDTDSASELRALARHPSVVAIGETGLDFNRNFSPATAQEHAFAGHIEIACEVELPLFLHERDAATRQLDILRQHRDQIPQAVIHCFTGEKSALYGYLDLDLYIGITGWLCDERRGLELQKLVKEIPLNRLLIETDAPYLLPRSLAEKPKNRRCEPHHLSEVLRTLAEHRSESEAELATATSTNSRRLFKLPTALD